MRKYVNIFSWLFLIGFAPITLLVLASQNSLPGDFFYPVKRGMEGTILAAASVNPNTQAIFHTELAQRRFSEAEKLLVARASSEGMKDFVYELKDTHKSIKAISDPVQKKELAMKLSTSIDNYETKLSQAETQIEVRYQQQQYQQYQQPQSQPQYQQQTQYQYNQQYQQPNQPQQQISPLPQITLPPYTAPSNPPPSDNGSHISNITSNPTPTPTQILPTSNPPKNPTPTAPIIVIAADEKQLIQVIIVTQEQLAIIQQDLKLMQAGGVQTSP